MNETEMDLAVEAVLDTFSAQTEACSLNDRIAVLDMLAVAVGSLLSADRAAHRQSSGVKR